MYLQWTFSTEGHFGKSFNDCDSFTKLGHFLSKVRTTVFHHFCPFLSRVSLPSSSFISLSLSLSLCVSLVSVCLSWLLTQRTSEMIVSLNTVTRLSSGELQTSGDRGRCMQVFLNNRKCVILVCPHSASLLLQDIIISDDPE